MNEIDPHVADKPTSDIFIVGPVRSGTSWLQTMLAEHPDVASPPETHLFSNYLAPLDDAWRHDRERVAAALDDPGSRVLYGLSTVVTDEEFVALVQSLYAGIRDLVLSAKAGATRFLEKTPDHAVCLDTIFRLAPDATVIYMVRHPHDTVRSLFAAGDEQWGDWAPHSLEEATNLWLRNVRPWFPRKRDPRVLLVRYEDLRSDPTELDRVAKFLGLEPPSTWLKSGVEAPPQARSSTVERGDTATRRSSPYSAAGFSYHDRRAIRELSRYEAAFITTRCRNEMQVLGYPVDIESLPRRLRVELLARAIGAKSRSWRRRAFRRRASERSMADRVTAREVAKPC